MYIWMHLQKLCLDWITYHIQQPICAFDPLQASQIIYHSMHEVDFSRHPDRPRSQGSTYVQYHLNQNMLHQNVCICSVQPYICEINASCIDSSQLVVIHIQQHLQTLFDDEETVSRRFHCCHQNAPAHSISECDYQIEPHQLLFVTMYISMVYTW
jgi:hypothetical protein